MTEAIDQAGASLPIARSAAPNRPNIGPSAGGRSAGSN